MMKYKLAAGDYSQLELRIYADRCGDETLIAAFNSGEDVWDSVMRMTGIDDRTRVKQYGYGRLYGAEAPKISLLLNQPVELVRKELEQLDARMPRMREYKEQVIRDARIVGYTETIMGRRGRDEGLYHPDAMIRSRAERFLFNFTIQGSAGEMTKLAMIEWHRRWGQLAPLLGQIHDELIIEYPDDDREETDRFWKGELKEVMESVSLLTKVKLEAQVGVGKNWKEAKG